MSYKRHFELLALVLLALVGCTDEFPDEAHELVSDDGVYRVALQLGAEDIHAGEPAEMEFEVRHDGEVIEVEMPELHYEQHTGGSESGGIDLEAHAMHAHHAMHTFESAGDYVLTFSFLAEAHHHEDGEDAAAHDDDEDGGSEAAHDEAADAGADADHAGGERSEHEFEITVREAEDHEHEAAGHTDDGHMH